MAAIVKYVTTLTITENGNEIVSREFTEEYEVTGQVHGAYWLDGSIESVTLCVRGTDLAAGGPGGAAITDPMVLGLSTVRGIAFETDINVDIRFNSADDVISLAQGNGGFAQLDAQIIQIARNDTRSGEIRYVVWGDR